MKNQEKIDPTNSEQHLTIFLALFLLKNSVFNEEKKQTVKELLVKYDHNLARL